LDKESCGFFILVPRIFLIRKSKRSLEKIFYRGWTKF